MKRSTLSILTILALFGFQPSRATESQAAYKDVAALVGSYQGNSGMDPNALPDCKVEITKSLSGLKVKITRPEGIRILDKYANGGERIVESVSQNVSAWTSPEIYGTTEDMSVWKRKTSLKLTQQKWVARFFSPSSKFLSFVKLSYDLNEFGFFKGPEVYYSAGCYHLKPIR